MPKVKLNKIYAGPEGAANPGEDFSCSKELVDELKAGGHVAAAGTGASKRETAKVKSPGGSGDDPAEVARLAEKKRRADEAEVKAKTPEAVKAALELLDVDNDAHWNEKGGKPSIEAVREMTGSTTLTRKELDAIAPDFVRPEKASVGSDSGENGDGEGRRSSAP